MATTRARRGAGLGEGGPKVAEDERRRELAKLDAVQEPRRRPVPLDWREPRRCVVCGDEFTPRRPIQTTCNMDEVPGRAAAAVETDAPASRGPADCG